MYLRPIVNMGGQSILIVDDEPLIALDVAQAFEDAGAIVTTTTTFREAMALVEKIGLTAAIVDHELGEHDSNQLYARLKARGIPFVTYSGHSRIDGACSDGVHVTKPVDPQVLVNVVARLVAGTTQSALASHI